MPLNCSNAHMRIRSARRRRAMIVAVGQSACLPLRIQRNLEEQTALGALNDDEKRSGCEHGHSERQEKLFFFSLLLAKPPHRRFPLAAGALLRNSGLHTDSRTGIRIRTGKTAMRVKQPSGTGMPQRRLFVWQKQSCCKISVRGGLAIILSALSLEVFQLRVIPVDVDGIVQTGRFGGSHLKPWALPSEVPGHLWSNYGDGDYELHVARNFLVDYTRYRKTDPPVSLVPSLTMRVACRALAGCPLNLDSNPTCWSMRCGRTAVYNDEVFHGVARMPKAPRGSVYIEGARDEDWGEICRSYECINVTIAAMSFFLRAKDSESLLGAARPASAWAHRPHFCSFLYLHLRPDRVRFRDVLANRSGTAIPYLHGSNRNRLGIFDEAVQMQTNYRFSIAFESSQEHQHYVTEKIVNSFLAGTIPIYWGSRDIHKYFNPRAFIDVSSFSSFEDAADHVLEVDRNATLAKQYLQEPPCTDENLCTLFWWRCS